MSFSQDLLEKILLLVLTAGVTGFLVPYVLKVVDDRKAQRQKAIDDKRLKEQKQYEAVLVRQSKIIDAQVQLLDNFATLIWEYQLLAIEVSYFNPVDQFDLYSAAVKEYDSKTGSTFAKIRAEISKALHLTTKDIYEELKQLYYGELLPIDKKLCSLMEKQRASDERITEWSEFNRYAVYTLADKIDETLNNLAKELRLKSGTVEYEPR
jgi:membrane-associated HD superfamily phosphohydrolase